jgi:hypothetical protein
LSICSDPESDKNWRNKALTAKKNKGLKAPTAFEAGLDNKKVLPLDNYGRKLQNLRANHDEHQRQLEEQSERDKANEEYLKQRELERAEKLRLYELKLRQELMNDAPPGGFGTVGVDSGISKIDKSMKNKDLASQGTEKRVKKESKSRSMKGSGAEIDDPNDLHEDEDEDGEPIPKKGNSKACVVS